LDSERTGSDEPELLIKGRESENPEHPVSELAIEYEAHPSCPVIAFTSISKEEGYQLYLARGVRTASRVPDRIEQLTDADYGVHAVSWESSDTLRYSRDGATYEQTFHSDAVVAHSQPRERHIKSEPLPFTQEDGQLVTLAKVVKCTSVPFVGDWCVRVHAADSGHTPKCTNNPTPPAMTHNHFAVYPQSDAKGGMNLWAGSDGGCFYIGEEHYSGKCVRVCYDGNFPGLSTIADAYEELLLIAAAAAGVSLGPTIAQALSYILGGLTIKPPTGVLA